MVRRDDLVDRVNDDLARAMPGVDDVSRVVVVRTVRVPSGVRVLRKASGMQLIARGSDALPVLVARRDDDLVALVPWSRFVAHMQRWWQEMSTRDKRTPGVRSEPHQRARKWQHQAAGLKRAVQRLSAENAELKRLTAALDMKGTNTPRDLDTQEKMLELKELRGACLAYLRVRQSRQPGDAASRASALRRMCVALGGE